MNMQKPRRLSQGATIGIIPPSSAAKGWEVESGVECLAKLGFKVKLSEYCDYQYAHGYFAAHDILRARAINEMFADHSVDAFMCIRGGYGAHRIVDKINWHTLQQIPRWFIGYSDITLLHAAIAKECNMISLHGPMLASDFAKGIDACTLDLFRKITMDARFQGILPHPARERVVCITSGCCEGQLVGGNLSLLTAALGTRYECDTRGKILLIEDVDEAPYSVDRMLSQLKLAGKLDAAAGIILGDFNDCEVIGKPTLHLRQVFDEIIRPLNKPTIYNYQTGHCMPMVSLL